MSASDQSLVHQVQMLTAKVIQIELDMNQQKFSATPVRSRRTESTLRRDKFLNDMNARGIPAALQKLHLDRFNKDSSYDVQCLANHDKQTWSCILS